MFLLFEKIGKEGPRFLNIFHLESVFYKKLRTADYNVYVLLFDLN